MDSVNDKLFVLQYGRLGSDQSQNDLFLPGYLGQRCETAGSLIIKLQEIGIHILFSEQDIRYGIIGTLACVGGMEITAAYMGVDDHILRCIGDHLIVNILVGFLELHNSLSGGSVQGMTDLVCEHAPGAVIQL